MILGFNYPYDKLLSINKCTMNISKRKKELDLIKIAWSRNRCWPNGQCQGYIPGGFNMTDTGEDWWFGFDHLNGVGEESSFASNGEITGTNCQKCGEYVLPHFLKIKPDVPYRLPSCKCPRPPPFLEELHNHFNPNITYTKL